MVDNGLGIGLGQNFIVADQSFHVVGITSERSLFGGVANAYVTLHDVQRAVYGGHPVIGAVLVTGDPTRVPGGYVLKTNQEISSATLAQMKAGVASINSTRYFMWIIAAIIVAALVYVTALERTRDFAVLKAVGATTGVLFAGLAGQAVLVSLMAAVIGGVLSTFMTGVFPQPRVRPRQRLRGPAAVGPARRAAGQPGRPPARRLGRSGGGLRGGVVSELEVRDLTVEFDSGGYKVRPLDGLSFDADDGELVVFLGPSGCGKTTLLSCLAGLLTATSGSIRFRDTEVTTLSGPELGAYRRSTVGVVFQAFNLIASLTARDNVMAPLRLAKVSRQRAGARADELLAEVGLTERAGHRPGKMSGGQQQRVAIARALVHDPPWWWPTSRPPTSTTSRWRGCWC